MTVGRADQPPKVDISFTYAGLMTEPWDERVRTLLEAAAPAVLTTYQASGKATISPVWFRWFDGAFEVVIAEG